MELALTEKTAIVTGGSQGIGRAIAASLATEGASVVIAARTNPEAAAAEIEETAASASGNVLGVAADVTDPDDVDRLVETTLEAYGEIDVLVNNVGIVGSERPFHEIPDEEWNRVLETNIMSTVRVTRTVLSHMRDRGSGSIINITSEAGTQPDPFKTHYDASKAAMINMTKNLSKTYGEEGIRVNAVSPATTKTPLVEDIFEERAEETGKPIERVEQAFLEEEKPGVVTGRLGKPEDVGNVVAFLASDKAEFVHGANWRVDGGSIWTMDA
ncbi:SDR family oxidoreductase [Natronolimnobius sp. AArcel1]|uniref:SDR family NAD(P)-dependent oxidoreductase n=1 Tax=Natronolimnobius sp. AArcel1 TaxID=1679093 RepID=UPI0013ECEE02|nr:SDR family oxidoreductase [Natronolimnobius sp. AArcel1]NGM70371.1 SDR family oxidoreductase [Natronolimnobius sp. AArcel1]